MRKIILLLLFIFSFAGNAGDSFSPGIRQNLIYATYIQEPEKVYVGQIFEVKVKLIVATKNFDSIRTAFIGGSSCRVLNSKSRWKALKNNIFNNTYYYKVLSAKAIFPKIKVSIYKKGSRVATYILRPIGAKIVKLQKNSIFSGVIAKDIKILKTKTTKFDDKTNIVVIEMLGKYANLRDFNVSNVIKNGIDSYDIKLPNMKIYYFAIIPKTEKKFEFSYFNSEKNRFQKVTIPIKVQTEDTSTQLELNPKKSKLSFYKNVALIAMATIFFIIFLFRRKIVYLLFVVAIGVYLFLFYNPFDSIVLKKGTKITILPTYNSIVFYIADKTQTVQKLNEIDGYIKIQLPNGKIGWIKKEGK